MGLGFSTSEINDAGIEGALTVGTTAVEVKVGSTIKNGREVVTLFNNSNAIMYWGYTSGVTTSSGTHIYPNQFIEWEIQYNITIYVIAGSANNNARITEL